MNANPYPTDLTDAEGDLLNHLRPPPQPGGRHRALDMRAVVHALLSSVDGGIPGRMRPHESPQWPSVYWDGRPGRDRGDGPRLQDPLRAQGRQPAGRHTHPPAGGLDRQSVKTTARGGARGSDTGKTVKGRQRPLWVETLGLLRA